MTTTQTLTAADIRTAVLADPETFLAHPGCTPEIAAAIDALVQAELGRRLIERLERDDEVARAYVSEVGSALWHRVHVDCASGAGCICQADPEHASVHSSRRAG